MIERDFCVVDLIMPYWCCTTSFHGPNSFTTGVALRGAWNSLVLHRTSSKMNNTSSKMSITFSKIINTSSKMSTTFFSKMSTTSKRQYHIMFLGRVLPEFWLSVRAHFKSAVRSRIYMACCLTLQWRHMIGITYQIIDNFPVCSTAVQGNIKENIKAPRYWPFMRG